VRDFNPPLRCFDGLGFSDPGIRDIEVGDRERRLTMLSDRPVQDDSEDELGFEPYADALAELILK
jgi:hypothetical protein